MNKKGHSARKNGHEAKCTMKSPRLGTTALFEYLSTAINLIHDKSPTIKTTIKCECRFKPVFLLLKGNFVLTDSSWIIQCLVTDHVIVRNAGLINIWSYASS